MASKTSDVRPKITLACTECKERNYITKKNRRNDPDRMELNKFCRRCRKHTAPPRDPLTQLLRRPARTSGGSFALSGGRATVAGSIARARPGSLRRLRSFVAQARVSHMPVDQSLVGREFPPTQPYRVSAEKVRELAAAPTGSRPTARCPRRSRS